MTTDVISITISDINAGTFVCTTTSEDADMSITYSLVEDVTLTN